MSEHLCPECRGLTVEFKGCGLDSQYKVCSRYTEPGHLTAEQIQDKIRARRAAVRPSGRFA